MEGKKDGLAGLKENVIIGKLIPAATGLKRYRRIEIEPAEPLPRADEVALLDSDELAAELGLVDDDYSVGLGAGFEQDLSTLEEIGARRRRRDGLRRGARRARRPDRRRGRAELSAARGRSPRDPHAGSTGACGRPSSLPRRGPPLRLRRRSARASARPRRQRVDVRCRQPDVRLGLARAASARAAPRAQAWQASLSASSIQASGRRGPA